MNRFLNLFLIFFSVSNSSIFFVAFAQHEFKLINLLFAFVSLMFIIPLNDKTRKQVKGKVKVLQRAKA